jgi:general secretion pathway protein K
VGGSADAMMTRGNESPPPHPASAPPRAERSFLGRCAMPAIKDKTMRQRGIALVLVLWVMALLAVMVVGFAGDARTELKLARNQADAAEARAIADTGVSLALLNVLDNNEDTAWRVDGGTHSLAYGDGTIRVSVQDEGGKIDLNLAPPALLASLFRTLGIDGGEALAAAIQEWRRQHGNGADEPLPRAGPFLALEQLRAVPGITAAIYARAAPFLTVYIRRDRIDPLTAPAEVLLSLPGARPAEVEAFLAARDRLGPVPGGLPALNGIGDSIAHAGLEVVTITSEGRTASGARFIRQAIVSASARGGAPYQILAWRQLQQPERPAE